MIFSKHDVKHAFECAKRESRCDIPRTAKFDIKLLKFTLIHYKNECTGIKVYFENSLEPFFNEEKEGILSVEEFFTDEFLNDIKHTGIEITIIEE